jgi:hypothetical protein
MRAIFAVLFAAKRRVEGVLLMARELQRPSRLLTGEWILMQAHVQQARARPSQLTFSDVIATVSEITEDEAQAAEVINYMLQAEHISFTNDTPRELRQLSS